MNEKIFNEEIRGDSELKKPIETLLAREKKFRVQLNKVKIICWNSFPEIKIRQ